MAMSYRAAPGLGGRAGQPPALEQPVSGNHAEPGPVLIWSDSNRKNSCYSIK